MRDGEVRLPDAKRREPCDAFHAGICPVLTGNAIKSECGCHHACRLKGMTALVADDDSDILHLNTRILERMGLRVIPCSNGRYAYDTVVTDRHPVDVAVLDVSMPGKDGFEICRAIRKRQESVPVVFATGYDGHDLGRVLEGLEANALVSKPFSLEQLRHVVGGVLCSFMGQHLFGDS
ncbi:MAG: response regulator [Kiritimatiellae bacterium]|nr:response regulator [Kiritimatiellia bacterium]